METASNALNTLFLGNTALQYLLFFGFTLGGILLGRIAYQIFKNILLKLAKKSENNLFAQLVEIIKSPLIVLIFTLGFMIGKQFLTLNESTAKLLDNVELILIQIVIFWFLLHLIDLLILRYLKPLTEKTESSLDDHMLIIFQKGIKTILVVLAIIIILSNSGYDIMSLLAGFGIGGLAIALAAQDAVKNLIAGIILLIDKPFKINDWIEIADLSGHVVDIGLRSTKLHSDKNTLLIFPNSMLLDSVVKNYTEHNIMKQILAVGISPFTPVDKFNEAIETIRETVRSIEGIDSESVSVRFIRFGESSLDLEVVYGLTDSHNWKMTIHNVNMGIKGSLDKIGVEIAVPIERGYPGDKV
ncbi:mechanosensitive ion channel family protein [bacterium]|nr:mechanosensitive ion channel family protein [candidate division CSSED10-310 bacterium]